MVHFDGPTQRVKTGCGNMYVALLKNPETQQSERVHVTLGKSGGCGRGFCEALAAALSWGIKAGGNLSEIAKEFRGIQCPEQIHEGAVSCADAVGIAIEQLLKIEKEGK